MDETITAAVAVTTEPGDRYVTTSPCCSACRWHFTPSRGGSTPSSVVPPPRSAIAIEPYRFLFTAPAKGRWIAVPLLTVCVREFAYIPPPLIPSTGEESGGRDEAAAILDHRITLIAYVTELCKGVLWLQGREAECREAGEAYRAALLQWYRKRRSVSGVNQTTTTSSAMDRDSDCRGADGMDDLWRDVQHEVRSLPPGADVDALLLHTLPPLLPLRQRDVVMHRVWRREGRIFSHDPIHVYRCDLVQRQLSQGGGVAGDGTARTAGASPPLALMVVNKPAGLPVHPSGCYRKNSITAILEDVFGGCDRHKYRYEEHRVTATGALHFASIIHRTEGFELIRVWIRDDVNSDGDRRTGSISGRNCAPQEQRQQQQLGVSKADWHLLRQLLSAPSHHSTEGPQTEKGEPTTPVIGAKHARESDTPLRTMSEAIPPLKTYVVHRLDTVTSGVLVFGLDANTARRTAALIAERKGEGDACYEGRPAANGPETGCTKTYVALVHGRVDLQALASKENHTCLIEGATPEDDEVRAWGSGDSRWLEVNRPIGCLSFHNSTYWCPGGAAIDAWLEEQQQQQRQKVAVPAAPSNGGTGRKKGDTAALAAKHAHMRRLTTGGRRPVDAVPQLEPGTVDGEIATFSRTLRSARTRLRVVQYIPESNTTLVVCLLFTGRTHQLRVHLSSLGHPICEDTRYVRLAAQLAGATDGVRHYYASHGPPVSRQGVELPAADEELVVPVGEGCTCPERICLHAWRYDLTYDHATHFQLRSELPPWAAPSTPSARD